MERAPMTGERTLAAEAAGARACLHCALARVLSAESPALRARGLDVRLGLADPVFLPAPGGRLYRGLRRLLRAAMAEAAPPGPVKLAVLNLLGKSHVEVTAAFPSAHGTRVLSCAFPHHDPAALARGFAEHPGSGE